MSKSVLIIMTSNDKMGDTGKQTGWYLPEVAHPYDVFKKAGYSVDLASVKGGKPPVDEGSVKAFAEDEVCKDFQSNEDVQKALENTTALKDISDDKVAAYDCVLFAGGFGTMWDFPDSEDVQRIAKVSYESSKILSAVCHGPIALANVKLSDGSLLVKDKEVTAFSNAEEDAVGTREVVPYTPEDKLSEQGAKFVKADEPWGVKVATVSSDNRVLMTGQNPASAGPLAEAIVKALS